MPIVRDTTASGGAPTTTAALTWSHTCTGSNLILVVFIWTTGTITGAKYNSVAMTSVTSTTTAGLTVQGFYMINPPTGSNTVEVDASASVSMSGMSVSYTGASQTSQPDAFNAVSATNTTNTLNTTVTTVASNTWIVGMGSDDNGDGVGIGNITGNGVAVPLVNGTWNGVWLLDSNATVPVGGNTFGFTNSVSVGVSGDRLLVAMSIAPAAAVATFVPQLLTLGVA